MVGAAASVGYPLGSVVFSRLAGRWLARAVSTLGWGLFGLGLLGVGALGDGWGIGAAGFVQQLGGGILLTSLIHDCYERFPYRYRARSMGVWAAFFFAGQFASPLMVSGMAAGLGGLRPAIATLGLAPLAVSALTLAFSLAGRLRPVARPA
jgi:MFS family permease